MVVLPVGEDANKRRGSRFHRYLHLRWAKGRLIPFLVGVDRLYRPSVEGVVQTGPRGAPRDDIRCPGCLGLPLRVVGFFTGARTMFVLLFFFRGYVFGRSHRAVRGDFCLGRVIPILIRHAGQGRLHPYLGDVAIRTGAVVANGDSRRGVFPIIIAVFRAYSCRFHLLFRPFHLRNERPQVGHGLQWEARSQVADQVAIKRTGFVVVRFCPFKATRCRLQGSFPINANRFSIHFARCVRSRQIVSFVAVIPIARPVQEANVSFRISCPWDVICLWFNVRRVEAKVQVPRAKVGGLCQWTFNNLRSFGKRWFVFPRMIRGIFRIGGALVCATGMVGVLSLQLLF